jgi:hypothetical protein
MVRPTPARRSLANQELFDEHAAAARPASPDPEGDHLGDLRLPVRDGHVAADVRRLNHAQRTDVRGWVHGSKVGWRSNEPS